MQYEDAHKHAAPGYYLVPNEDTVQWRKIIKGLRIDRAAAICSSGEVGLIALLPSVRKELVLVDHSYASLSVAMLKFVMLRELGAAETRRLLTGNDDAALRKNIDKFVLTLPKEVQNAYKQNVQVRGFDGDFTRRPSSKYDYSRIDPKTGYYVVLPQNDGEVHPIASSLKREWKALPQREIYRCATKLNKVRFLHGDLSDLVERGPFDLLYLSNALDHRDRNKKHPDPATLTKSVKPGGYIIVAHRKSYDPYETSKRLKKSGWELVSNLPTIQGMGWTQSLFRLPVNQEVAA